MTHNELNIPEPFGQTSTIEEAGVRDSSQTLSIDCVCELHSLLSLRASWDALVERAPVTVFQTFDWLALWWKHFGSTRYHALHILVFKHQEKVVGILPFFIDTKILFHVPVYKVLRFMGSGVHNDTTDGIVTRRGPSDFLDGIIDPDYQYQVVAKFIAYFRQSGSIYDEIELSDLPEESIFKKELQTQLVRQGISFTFKKTDECPRLRTPESTASYFENLHHNIRRRLLHARKIFENGSTYRIETVTSLSTMEDAFKDLVNLHQTRWNRIGFPGLFSDARFERFQEELFPILFRRGEIWLKAARVNGVRIAVRAGFSFKNRLYDYVSGFDDRPPWSKYRPGLALLLAMIEDAILRHCHSLELLRGNEQYKFELTSDYNCNWLMRINNPSAPARMRFIVYGVMKQYEKIMLQLSLERLLLQTHRRQHGVPQFLFKYASFRIKRLFEKVHGKNAPKNTSKTL